MKYKTLAQLGGALTALWLIRVLMTGNLGLGYIIFNTFLAAIPLLVEAAYPFIRRRMPMMIGKISVLFTSLIWLLFLPNAFYVLTDLMHLNPAVVVNARGDSYRNLIHYTRGDGLFIFDSFILVAATVFSAYMGAVALLHASRYFHTRFTSLQAKLFLGAIMLLSSLGVYIGRYSRWNSWEGLIFPHRIVRELITDLGVSYKRERFIYVMLTITLFEVCSYWYVRNMQRAAKQTTATS